MRLHRPNGDDVAGNRVNGDVPGSLGTSSSAGRRLPLLGRAGVGALLAPAADLGGVGAATSQRWRAYCKRWPSLRRLILKPRKIVFKGAFGASLRADP
jgi:hypothetical protein